MKITLEKGQKLWFTSDTHFDHSNICSATTKWEGTENTSRDFKSLEHMNSTLVDNMNSLVKEDDILFHLGDWSFNGFENIQKFRERINCKNIHLILGNHDHHIERNRENIQSLFTSVNKYLELTVEFNKDTPIYGRAHFVLMHYPIASWNNLYRGHIHLHGHVHLPSDISIAEGKAMDVGVDGNDYKPVSMREVLRIMSNRPIRNLSLSKDHHETIK